MEKKGGGMFIQGKNGGHVDRVTIDAGTMWSLQKSHAFRKFLLVKCVSRGPQISLFVSSGRL